MVKQLVAFVAIVALVVAASHASNGEMRQFRNRLWGGRPPQVNRVNP